MFPSPTMVLRPDNQYRINLINNLGAESSLNGDTDETESYRSPNTTNIHTHGLHISGESPGDSIFTVAYPGWDNITYIWNIPCHHTSGTHWWYVNVI